MVPLLAAGEVLDIRVDVLVAAEAVVGLIVEGDREGFGRRQLIDDRIRAFASVDRRALPAPGTDRRRGCR